MAVLKASTIEGNLDVGDGTAGAVTCNGAMTTKGNLLVGDGTSGTITSNGAMTTKGNLTVGDGATASLKANGAFEATGAMTAGGNFTISTGNPAQYRICRQQSGTAGLVEWIDFAVYDTNGSTRLF